MRRSEHLDLFGHYLIPPDGRGPREQTKHAMRVVLAKERRGASDPGVSNAGMRCDTTCLRKRGCPKGTARVRRG